MLARLRIRQKIALLLVVPLTAVALTMATFAADRAITARTSQATAETALVARDIGGLIQALQQERLFALGYLVVPTLERSALAVETQTAKAELDRLANQARTAEIIARAISNGGTIISRGHLAGDIPGIKAHLECRGLILNGGDILAIPELHGMAEGVDMSHEAAVGKINQDEILYLMSRGLSEDEATATIVRGFMSVDIPGLPPDLKNQIDAAVAQTNQEVM